MNKGIETIKLLFAGKQLYVLNKISDYNIQKELTIHMA